MTQTQIPCSVYRGGTSRGLFFHKKDLPREIEKRNEVFLKGIDAFNESQIDGLGSGTSHTSKVVVIDKAENSDDHVEYTFYQIGIGVPVVDDKGTCGNLMAAVGAFAVNEGLVPVKSTDSSVIVNVLNTNINRKVKITVPIESGVAKVSGSYLMPGIVTKSAKYKVNIIYPGAAKTEHTLPLGSTSIFKVKDVDYEGSFVDIVNPFIFVGVESLHLKGNESTAEIAGNHSLMELLNDIRNEAAVKVGFANDKKEARQSSPTIPKIAVVAEPQNYRTTSGIEIAANEIDLSAKMVSMGKLHRTFAGSGLYNLAAATLLPGTIPNKVSKLNYDRSEKIIRIGHPDGIAEVRVALTEDKRDVYSVGLDRTARLIMRGSIYIP